MVQSVLHMEGKGKHKRITGLDIVGVIKNVPYTHITGHTAGIVSLLTYLSRGRELIFPKEWLSIVWARVLGMRWRGG